MTPFSVYYTIHSNVYLIYFFWWEVFKLEQVLPLYKLLQFIFCNQLYTGSLSVWLALDYLIAFFIQHILAYNIPMPLLYLYTYTQFTVSPHSTCFAAGEKKLALNKKSLK